MSEKKAIPGDAGRRSLDHYQRRLPAWRLAVRDFLIPIVRYETPVLAYLQQAFRTPALDTYFALTANLGTHTFYMIFLPFLFWCGYSQVFRAMINLLASGVFFTGVLKDLVCLPRPLSPPLQRISQSSSAPLEYGFPSTHSTNAVSVAVYGVYLLRQDPQDDWVNVSIQLLLYFFTTTIIVGRLYCGMHGFFDCIIGSLLGAGLAALQCVYGDAFDAWIWYGPLQNVVIVALICCVLVRIHPEPADDCPCFDDSVAFSGVMIGIQFGSWHFARSGFATLEPVPSSPFSIQEMGWIVAAARIVIGVPIILLWRSVAKPTLLKLLPPVFRVFETLGLSLPRKYFLKASEYNSVPHLRKDDHVIPPASDIPAMFDNLRHPRRRTISIGPQSEADAYEMMAVRERRRRGGSSSPDLAMNTPKPAPTGAGSINRAATANGRSDNHSEKGSILPNSNIVTATGDDNKTIPFPLLQDPSLPDTHIDDQDDQALFAKLQVPRVRYDVEVITKLVVYAGIGWIACEGAPIFFELCGLGMGTVTVRLT